MQRGQKERKARRARGGKAELTNRRLETRKWPDRDTWQLLLDAICPQCTVGKGYKRVYQICID